jgi:hypothetical protein
MSQQNTDSTEGALFLVIVRHVAHNVAPSLHRFQASISYINKTPQFDRIPCRESGRLLNNKVHVAKCAKRTVKNEPRCGATTAGNTDPNRADDRTLPLVTHDGSKSAAQTRCKTQVELEILLLQVWPGQCRQNLGHHLIHVRRQLVHMSRS